MIQPKVKAGYGRVEFTGGVKHLIYMAADLTAYGTDTTNGKSVKEFLRTLEIYRTDTNELIKSISLTKDMYYTYGEVFEVEDIFNPVYIEDLPIKAVLKLQDFDGIYTIEDSIPAPGELVNTDYKHAVTPLGDLTNFDAGRLQDPDRFFITEIRAYPFLRRFALTDLARYCIIKRRTTNASELDKPGVHCKVLGVELMSSSTVERSWFNEVVVDFDFIYVVKATNQFFLGTKPTLALSESIPAGMYNSSGVFTGTGVNPLFNEDASPDLSSISQPGTGYNPLNTGVLVSVEEMRQYVSVNTSTTIEKLKPHITRAERKHLIPLVGKVLYNQQVERYVTAGHKVPVMNGVYRELHVLLQEALANIAMLNYIAQAQLQMGDSGIRISTNDNMKTAFQWQIEDLKFQLGKDGFNALEEILVFMEENAGFFPGWKTSDAYYQQKELFVNTAAEFDQHFGINGSRMTYLHLRYIMRRVEEFSVKDVVGKALYSELKGAIKLGSLTDKQRELILKYLAPATTLLTVSKAIVERSVEVTDFGVSVNLYGYYGNMKQKDPASIDDKKEMIAQLEKDGGEFLQGGLLFIQENVGDFAAYEAPVSHKTSFTAVNTSGSGFFKV